MNLFAIINGIFYLAMFLRAQISAQGWLTERLCRYAGEQSNIWALQFLLFFLTINFF